MIKQSTVIALDLGTKTVGVAKSDGLGMFAHPYDTFRFEEGDYGSAVNYVVSLTEKFNITTIVLGLPKRMDGTIGTQAEISLAFKEKLEAAVEMPIVMFDERLSSKAVDKQLISFDVKRKQRKQKKDELAAVNFLQAYLDGVKLNKGGIQI